MCEPKKYTIEQCAELAGPYIKQAYNIGFIHGCLVCLVAVTVISVIETIKK